MYRQPNGSSFPSFSDFPGGNPNKRCKIQECQNITSTGGKSQKLEQEAMDDEEWEELDETAMEECMVLATQMCSKTTQNQDEAVNQKSSQYQETARTKYGKSIPTTNYLHTKNQTCNTSEQFSSSYVSDSRPLHNRIKSSETSDKQSNTSKNSYSSRFTDFSIPSCSSQRVSSTTGRSVHTSGKVYNAVPMKGSGGTVSSTKMYAQPSYPTRRLEGEEDQQELLKKEQEERAKCEEEVLLKQGEISLLRLELKRKDAALEAERLDRCAAIDAAEKRGKEKVANIAAEAEAKTKDSMRMIEKLKAEMHFKNQEVEELTSRCRKLEKKTRQCSSGVIGTSPKLGRNETASPLVSPGKVRSNFMFRHDFGGGLASVHSVEVQTEFSHQQVERRQRLKLATPRGQVSSSRSTAYLLSAGSSMSSSERTSTACISKNWNLSYEWSYLASQIIMENDILDREKKLMTLAIERLQEVHSLITSREAESNWCEKKSQMINQSPMDWYERHVGPALHVIWSFTSHKSADPVALQVMCKHLSPLFIKEVVVNNRIRPVILEILERVARRFITPLDTVVCKQIIVALTDCSATVDSDSGVLSILKVVLAMSPHTALSNLLCTTTGSCLVGKLCSCIGKLCVSGITTAATLLNWIRCLVMEPPPWFRSSCSCPSQLLAVLLKEVYKLLDFSDIQRGCRKTNVYNLLLSSVHVLHCWSTVDPDWWEKVAHLPHYTALMGFIIANAKEIQPDKQTVDLLCDLYEFDEGTFDNYEKS